ncbi:MAG: guanylate kinase [Clostridia bacterium]|nr:guanylate kinase [Clostridia bacterium]
MRFDRKGLLIVFSGPSGVGKGTVRKRFFEKMGDKLYYSISMTTRAMREGETNGVDYHFVSREKFLEEIQNDNVLEYNEYVGNFYGTPKDIVFEKINNGIDVVLEIEVNGAKMIKEKVPNCVSIFIAPPSYDALKDRLVGRNTESPEVIEKRLIKAEDEISSANLYDYIVINDDIEEAANEVISIIESEHLRVDRILNDYYKFIWRR